MKSALSSSLPPASSSARPFRVGDDGFISDVILEAWLRAGEAVRAGWLLRSRDGRRFVLQDALRVLGRRSSETDPYGLIGRVETLRELVRQGAVIAADGIRIGPAVYDVEFGVIAVSTQSADESGMNHCVG